MLRVRETDGSNRARPAQAVVCKGKAYTNSSVGVLCRDFAAKASCRETIQSLLDQRTDET